MKSVLVSVLAANCISNFLCMQGKENIRQLLTANPYQNIIVPTANKKFEIISNKRPERVVIQMSSTTNPEISYPYAGDFPQRILSTLHFKQEELLKGIASYHGNYIPEAVYFNQNSYHKLLEFPASLRKDPEKSKIVRKVVDFWISERRRIVADDVLFTLQHELGVYEGTRWMLIILARSIGPNIHGWALLTPLPPRPYSF